MDLDIMASVQEQIIGNCLCVLGDAMAMPIGSMVRSSAPSSRSTSSAPARSAAMGVTVPEPEPVAIAGADPDVGRY